MIVYLGTSDMECHQCNHDVIMYDKQRISLEVTWDVDVSEKTRMYIAAP